MSKKDEVILANWNNVCEANQDKDTPFCIALTADMSNASYEQVVDALARNQKEG
jgi:hypothetical protein